MDNIEVFWRWENWFRCDYQAAKSSLINLLYIKLPGIRWHENDGRRVNCCWIWKIPGPGWLGKGRIARGWISKAVYTGKSKGHTISSGYKTANHRNGDKKTQSPCWKSYNHSTKSKQLHNLLSDNFEKDIERAWLCEYRKKSFCSNILDARQDVIDLDIMTRKEDCLSTFAPSIIATGIALITAPSWWQIVHIRQRCLQDRPWMPQWV